MRPRAGARAASAEFRWTPPLETFFAETFERERRVRGFLREQALGIFREYVYLDIHRSAGAQRMQVCRLEGMRDDGDGQLILLNRRDREADALDGDRAFEHHVTDELGRERDAQPVVFAAADFLERRQSANAIDVSLNDVAAQARPGFHRQLEVDERLGREARERRARDGFGG